MSVFPVSRLVFGTARLHRVTSRNLRAQIIEESYAHGVRQFDTAPSYGMGVGESLVGDVFQGRSDIAVNAKVGLITKQPITQSALEVLARKAIFRNYFEYLHHDFSYDSMQLSFEATLRRIRQDKVKTLFFHEPQLAQVEIRQFLKFIAKNEGVYENIGVAGDWPLISDVCELLAYHGLHPIIQTSINTPIENNKYAPNYLYGAVSRSTENADLSADKLGVNVNILYSALSVERVEYYHRNVFGEPD